MMEPPRLSHLLLVDDDALLRTIAAKTLRHARFRVSEAASGEDALAQFEQHDFDLVLLDVMMPGLDGYEVCRRIRATAWGARVPILILTGLDDTGSIERAYAHGATDFITKPINWTLLSHRVVYALRASAAAEAMLRSREGLARAQSLARMGNWAVTPDGHFECSAEQYRIYGVPSDFDLRSFAGSADKRVVAADRERVSGARARMAKQGVPYQLEFQIVREDGAIRTVFEQAASVPAAHGRGVRFEGITQDITERVQAAQRIRQLAFYDETTGLPNREFFAELAQPLVEAAARDRGRCAMLHLDLDRFVRINDAFERSSGDAVLKAVAGRLRSFLCGADPASRATAEAEQVVLARVGANAFTLLVTDLAGPEQAAAVAQQLLDAVAQPIEVESRSLVLTASIGIALFPDHARDLQDLRRCAEQALQAAKAAGRARFRFFDQHMHTRAASRLVMEADLRRAITQDELRLYFQPKVDAATGTIVAAEALVRWQHPERGLVPSGEFIPLAEETGLILPLTDWVLEAACRSLRRWSDAGLPGVRLSVNLAAASVADHTLTDKLDRLMQRYQLDPASLMLEMTETMLVHDVEPVISLLETLRVRGYGMSLDDFGTGYSSLSYLQYLPVDELKIDRAFVTHAPRGRRDGALAIAIIALARELGLQVVAEGVETPEQSAFLLERGCNVQQGYLFSRPLPVAAFEQLLRDGAIRPPVPASASIYTA